MLNAETVQKIKNDGEAFSLDIPGNYDQAREKHAYAIKALTSDGRDHYTEALVVVRNGEPVGYAINLRHTELQNPETGVRQFGIEGDGMIIGGLQGELRLLGGKLREMPSGRKAAVENAIAEVRKKLEGTSEQYLSFQINTHSGKVIRIDRYEEPKEKE